MEHICTNVFPPNIAEIRKLCMERCKPKILSFDEAWGVVQKAMADYGWYHPQEAFAIMDELTLSVVKNLGWSRLCQSENPTAERANFREAYMRKAAEAQNTNSLPDFFSIFNSWPIIIEMMSFSCTSFVFTVSIYFPFRNTVIRSESSKTSSILCEM